MDRMGYFFLCGLIAGILAGCERVDEAPGDLPGGEEIVGAWRVPAVGEIPAQQVHFSNGRRFDVDVGLDGTEEYSGQWTVEDGRLVVAYWENADKCPLIPGAYRFVIEEDRLALTEVLDECEERRESWGQAPLARVEEPRDREESEEEESGG